MKICMLASTYFPFAGGAETYARNLAEKLVSKGHDLTVVTDGSNIKASQEEYLNGVHILRTSNYVPLVNDPVKVRWRQMQFALFQEIFSLIKNKEFDVIHANSYEAAIFGSTIALHYRAPLVCSLHEQWPEKEPFGIGKCELVYCHLPVARYIVASNFYLEKALAFTSRDSLSFIYHGIDIHRFSAASGRDIVRQRLNIQPTDYLLVCAARIYERKGLFDLVDAINIVKDQFPMVNLLIAGASSSQEYASRLYHYIQQLQLNQIIQIIETFTNNDMPDVMAAADLIVQPSHAEGLGLAVIEAMAAQKAIIGTDVTGISEVLEHEVTGLLVPPHAPEALAEAIIRLVKDQHLSQRLSIQAFSMACQRFSIERMVNETESVYKEILQQK